MADVFVSYARTDKALVAPLVAAIEGRGWSVWWDPEIAPGQEFDEQIAAELGSARAVVVVWTPVSVASRWVRGEAREAADRGILVPARFDGARAAVRRSRDPHDRPRRLGRRSREPAVPGTAARARSDRHAQAGLGGECGGRSRHCTPCREATHPCASRSACCRSPT